MLRIPFPFKEWTNYILTAWLGFHPEERGRAFQVHESSCHKGWRQFFSPHPTARTLSQGQIVYWIHTHEAALHFQQSFFSQGLGRGAWTRDLDNLALWKRYCSGCELRIQHPVGGRKEEWVHGWALSLPGRKKVRIFLRWSTPQQLKQMTQSHTINMD